MTCKDAARLLHPYVDGELDAAHCIEIDDHLSTCAACAKSLEELNVLGAALRSPAMAFELPPDFEKRARAAIPSRRDSVLSYQWLAIAAMIVLAAFLGWRFAPLADSSDVVHDLMNSHVRSLMADHLVDVQSSDRHTVKPWFTGKIDFSPDVEDLAPKGFPLTGGRLDYIGGRPVAVLIYHRNKHVINVYTWPGDAPARSGSESGFQFEHWTHAGMNYWAVSDVSSDDLNALARLLGRP
jgi:anti-sigma factor RsiW